tara:strand:+ start:329 stop:655 length:327 start_codon:yes stop_codon:yes gene_type:complete
MNFKQKMVGVNKNIIKKHEDATWTKISTSGDGKTFILKQFDGDTLDTIALTIEELNAIHDFVNQADVEEEYCESCSRPKDYCRNFECAHPCDVCGNRSDDCSCSGEGA